MKIMLLAATALSMLVTSAFAEETPSTQKKFNYELGDKDLWDGTRVLSFTPSENTNYTCLVGEVRDKYVNGLAVAITCIPKADAKK